MKQTLPHKEADQFNFSLDPERIRQTQDMLIAWFEINGRDLPWRHTRDPYQILVAEIMLQQTQVDRVKPKYAAFLQQFPTIEALAQASSGDVIRAWAGLGYNRRALNLQRTAQAVLNEHDGQFPDTPDTLRSLPGIGPYTAGAIACFAFERDVAFMDTNIRRVITRVFVGADDGNMGERGLLEIASAAVAKGRAWVWNQAIMELGALVCTATKPRCQLCPLRRECRAYAAWCEADQAIFTYVPRHQALAKVAERRMPFAATTRYFRGRIIHILRQLDAGTWLPLAELGPQIKHDWASNDEAWLQSLLQGLANDGLVELDKEQRARLP